MCGGDVATLLPRQWGRHLLAGAGYPLRHSHKDPYQSLPYYALQIRNLIKR